VPVLFLSGYVDEIIEEQARSTGPHTIPPLKVALVVLITLSARADSQKSAG
jgi:hypothetical protein